MSDMEIFKCPVHSLTPYRNRIEENDLTYPDQMQHLVYDAVRQQPSDDYYFEAVRPQVNALLSHFMERFFLPNFKAMRANTRDNSLDNQYLALVDDYHGYQLELYNDYFLSLYTSEMQLKGPEVSNLDRNLWQILGQLTGPLVKGRHQTEAYAALRELFDKLQVDNIFLSTPQTKLVFSGVGTAMKFTNILRNVSEKYSWQQIHNGSITSEEAYSEVFETARSSHKLLPELMSLPIHGGARILDEVLD